MKTLVNINGEIFPPEKAVISVFDRSFLFGDSVYDVTRSYDGVLFNLEEHLDRLWNSAKLIGMPIKWSKEKIKDEISKTIEQLNTKNAYIRVVITRGEDSTSIALSEHLENNIIIFAKEFPENPKWWYEKGVYVKTASILRNDKQALDPNIKSGNYLNNILALKEVNQQHDQNVFDAIMLNQDGMVTESTISNVWIVKDGMIITPKLSIGILQGITRETIFKIAKKENLKLEERNFSIDEMKNAKEAFLSSSTREIIPIRQVDDSVIGDGKPGKTTHKVIKLYRDFIKNYSLKC